MRFCKAELKDIGQGFGSSRMPKSLIQPNDVETDARSSGAFFTSTSVLGIFYSCQIRPLSPMASQKPPQSFFIWEFSLLTPQLPMSRPHGESSR